MQIPVSVYKPRGLKASVCRGVRSVTWLNVLLDGSDAKIIRTARTKSTPKAGIYWLQFAAENRSNSLRSKEIRQKSLSNFGLGYPAGEVAKALGYRTGSSVTRAVAQVESGNERLKHTAAKLERKLH